MVAASLRILIFGKSEKLSWKAPTLGSLHSRYNYLISGVDRLESVDALNVLTSEIEELYFIFNVDTIVSLGLVFLLIF